MTRSVLLVGGTGVFGARLARHLARSPELALTVTSRRAEAAAAAAARLNAAGAVNPVRGLAFDRADAARALRQWTPWTVIDASGPFQRLDYALVTAAIAAGSNVIDLADARGYLLGYRAANDQHARAAGVSAIAGASSTPALSGAVIQALTRGWRRIDTIDVAITPGGRSEVGPAVIAAVLSYAGRPAPVWSDGVLSSETGWRGGHDIDIAGLGRRRVALVETADAELFGPAFAVRKRLAFHAGLESAIEQRGLELLAVAREKLGLGSLDRLVPLFVAARRVTRRFTSDRGGMTVAARGIAADGRPAGARWQLIAEQDQGPYVPVMAAAAAVRKLLRGELEAGAAIASDRLDLAEIVAEMHGYAIRTAFDATPSPPHFDAKLLKV